MRRISSAPATARYRRISIPLDEYIPFMFRPTGQCGASMDWTLFGQGMPWWIIVSFWGYLIALGISIIWQIAAYFVKRHRSASNA